VDSRRLIQMATERLEEEIEELKVKVEEEDQVEEIKNEEAEADLLLDLLEAIRLLQEARIQVRGRDQDLVRGLDQDQNQDHEPDQGRNPGIEPRKIEKHQNQGDQSQIQDLTVLDQTHQALDLDQIQNTAIDLILLAVGPIHVVQGLELDLGLKIK